MGTPSQEASVGARFTYTHPDGKGFGEHHLGTDLTAEMKELDLPSGQDVTLEAYDEDSGWPVVGWVDSHNIDRMTSIEPGFFDEHFTPAAD